MSGNESDSSEDEWVISTSPTNTTTTNSTTTTTKTINTSTSRNGTPISTPPLPISNSSSTTTQTTATTPPITATLPPITIKRPAVSAATIRTIRASLPNNVTSPASAAIITPSSSTSTINTHNALQRVQEQAAYITPEDLDQFCQYSDSQGFIRKLVETYKNAETYLRIREIETQKLTIDVRLSEHLHECPDPGAFVLQLIYDLAVYYKKNPVQGRTLKFQRYLVQAICHAFHIFTHTPPTKYKVPKKMQEETDLISFAEEPNLISFDDEEEGNQHEEEDEDDMETSSDDDDGEGDDDDDVDDDSEAEDNIATITLSELLDIPSEAAARYTMTRQHQEACVRLLDTIPTPILVYYAMDVFKLQDLIGKGGDLEEDGVNMCKLLMRNGHYNEAVSCIRKLNLFDAFPIEQFAAKMFAANQGGILPVYTSGQLTIQRQLLEYINIQLRYTFAGNLGIVPAEYLTTVHEDEKTTPPLPRLRERRFQKELSSCATKILQELNIDEVEYYFIWLSQRHACLRWIIKARASQQCDENDMSIAASSNYNGLIELVAGEDPAIAKLAIKEFVDMNDSVAATSFAGILRQQQFYIQYYSLPLRDRVVGMIKGETLSSRFIQSSPRNSPVVGNQIYYQMPKHVRTIMVDNHHQVMQLKSTLTKTTICGLDTEWVPQFARSGAIKTALMQIASDQGVVYLVDIAKALHPTNIALLQDIDLVLRMLFEEPRILKLTYDFHGDFTLLKECMPTASDWYTANLVDLKTLRTKNDEPIPGGLSGVISSFLGVTMNKKQQLSNWEQRPLTMDQATYAASDSYSLIEVYFTLVAQHHPFLKSIKNYPPRHPRINHRLSTLSSSTPSPPLPTSHSVEPDLVQF
ncbi:hypothetical protein BDA99DRAFT_607234 [Phascolomyces articulosus]|uniref:3'-5' exonuclease domain-containing protein n=1 Tax=Phascolomyces articulosus TaxID=60185 RepID=A0AAD5K429_9FUNG|nr:hypothetical protein BDA99DRAFT_607234 [Phascolomyces articulosus]